MVVDGRVVQQLYLWQQVLLYCIAPLLIIPRPDGTWRELVQILYHTSFPNLFCTRFIPLRTPSATPGTYSNVSS